MRLLKKDRSGVSEIVGAMMLVLIVVIAASSFAIFLSQYQASEQAQRLDDQKRTQEKIKITSIVPLDDDDDGMWDSFNFTITSLHNERSEISRMAINDNTVRQFTVWRISEYTGMLEDQEYEAGDTLILSAREAMTVLVEVADFNSMYNPSAVYSTDGYVKMDIITGWMNSFSKTFAPPSSVATHSPGSWYNTYTGQYEYYVTLNGRSSVGYDGAYIMSWNWTVKSTNYTDPTNLTDIVWTNATGSVCRVDFPFQDAFNEVTLTVTDNFGMIGRSTISFYN
jgi:hypothetical protein